MPAQVVSQAATVDWNIVAGALATFIITAIVAWSGRQAGKKKTEAEDNHLMPTVMTGAVLQDNYTIVMATEASRHLAEELRLSRNSTERLRDEMVELRTDIERLTRALSS